MSQVTTHVLDTAAGRPAAGVAVRLERGRARSSQTGRPTRTAGSATWGRTCSSRGRYRLRFDTSARSGFFPEVVVAFTVADDAHVHVPLLLSPYGYSTYRGS